jgi:membrane protease YdiL (CAAX protease family)
MKNAAIPAAIMMIAAMFVVSTGKAEGKVIAGTAAADQSNGGTLESASPTGTATTAADPLVAHPWLAWVVPATALASIWLIIRFRWHRLHHLPREQPALPPPALLGMALLMILLGTAGASAARTILGVPAQLPDDPQQVLALETKLRLGAVIGQVLVVVLAWQLARLATLQRALAQRSARRSAAADDAAFAAAEPPNLLEEPPGKRVSAPRAILIGVAAMALLFPIVASMGMLSTLVQQQWTGRAADPIAHESLRQLQNAPRDGWFFLFIALALIATPILEEIMYRGLLQPAFRGALGLRWPAIAITSLCFALMHLGAVEPVALPVLFSLSLGLGWARERTGGLLAPITMHIAFNAVNLALAL